MRYFGLVLLSAGMFVLGACRHDTQQSDRESQAARERHDSDSSAFKAGEAAHKVAKEADRVAAVAARKLAEDARKAREGWKEQERIEKEKKTQ